MAAGGAYYRKTQYYGSYPHSVKERIYAMFPDARKILHLFSGTVRDFGSISYDIKPEMHPDICDDVRNIKAHASELADVDLVAGDPPYGPDDFKKYGVQPFNKTQVLRDLGEILQSGACVAWLDTYAPMYRKDVWKRIGLIGIVVSTNTRIRCLSIFERV